MVKNKDNVQFKLSAESPEYIIQNSSRWDPVYGFPMKMSPSGELWER